MGDLAGDEVSNPQLVAVANLTEREVADAVWLAAQWHAADQSAAAEVPSSESVTSTGSGEASRPPWPRQAEPAPDSDDQDQTLALSEVTWGSGLARHRLEPLGRPVTPVRVSLDRSVPRSLRTLKQTLPSAQERILDEEATAKLALVDSRWIPVFRPADELRWDVVLVIDDSPSMALWRFATKAFAELLIRQGAFQNVTLRLLCPQEKGGYSLRGTAPGAPRHDISEVLAPAGRRIVVVLTDGVSDGWRSGSALAVLNRWARTLPVALVHLLPWRMWRNTGFRLHRLAFQAPAPGMANRRLSWRPQAAAANPLYEDLGELTPVPVLGLSAYWLKPWARLVAGCTAGWTNLPAVLVGTSALDASFPDGPDLDAAQRVAEFRATVDPVTFELATYLAAAPLDLSVMRAVQQAMLPSSELANLSEFLACGLVEPVELVHEGAVRMMYEFGPGVREELLAAGRRLTTAHVLQVVEQVVPGAHGFGLSLAEEAGESAAAATALPEPFLSVRAAALAAMSADQLEASRRLQQHLAERGRLVESIPTQGRSSPEPTESPQIHGPPEPRARTRRQTPDTGGVEVSPVVGPGMEERRVSTRVSPTVWGGVPPRNPNFIGREDLLRQLHERLEPGAMTAVLPQALHGLGGVGKSQLAVEYAYRHREDFDIIWWIPAELPVQIQGSLAELGQRLELGIPSEVNVAVGVVLDALKGSARGGRQIPPNWLLIFDNAEDPKNVLPYLPTGGPGRILVTSRNSQWLNLARPLEVDVFQRVESIELLQRRGPDLNDDDADRLASALGDLPLAIEQAAAWRAETGMPADEYIQLLNEKQVEMLDLPGPLDYQKSVAAAWNLSLDKLRASNPTALRVLQVCAFFAPEPIPRSMFANARGLSVEPDLDRALHDRLRLNEAIRDINRYALARIDHRINSIQMHRLVQAVLISQMSEDERATMRHGAHLLLAANDPLTPDEAEQWAKYGQLYPHVVASHAIDCGDSAVRELALNMTQFLYYWGEVRASCDMSKQVYHTWRSRFGPDHVDTLKVGRWYGYMLFAGGEFQRAAEFNEELLEVHRQALGDEHEDTLDAINNVAGDRRAQGDFTGALDLSRTIYQRCVERFGDNDPLTLIAAHNVGVSLRLCGQFAEAMRQDEVTWQRRVEAYGTDHALSLTTQVGLTLDQRELGEYVKASTTHDDIVGRYRLVHGPLNPATLRAIMHQAGMRRKAGDLEGATAAADEAYDGLLTRFGPDHPHTIAAQLSRSINLRLAGDLGEALRLGEDVLERYRRVLGDDHPHTMAARTELGVTLRLRGDVDRARELNQMALDGLRARLGEDNSSTLIAAMNLASDMFALGRHETARDMDTAIRDRATRVLGANHPVTLAIKANLAQDLRALSQEEAGRALQVEVHFQAIEKLGPENPAVAAFTNPDQRVSCDIDPMPL